MMVKRVLHSFIPVKYSLIDSSSPPPFSQEKLRGAALLPYREDLIREMPTRGTVAELGVDRGDFSEKIFEISKPKVLFLVDVWSSKRYSSREERAVRNRFEAEISSGQVEVCKESSLDFGVRQQPDSLDWVYIDTDHSFKTTLGELRALAPAVRPGGYICGHDFTWGNVRSGYRYGVVQAVATFMADNRWRLSHLSLESSSNWSFALQRPPFSDTSAN